MFAALVPALAALGVLAGVPVLIHFLTRQRTVTRDFPAARLLARVAVGRSQRHRLRERLALLLRTLAIIAGVLAAIGLLWRGSLLGDGRPAVIIIDASASMQQRDHTGNTAFAAARSVAGRLAGQLVGRPLTVIVATQPPQMVQGSTAGDVVALLAEAMPGFGDGDITNVLGQALTKLPQGGDIYLVSDLARSSLIGVDPATLPAAVNMHLVAVNGGGDNVGIVGLLSEPGIALAGRPVLISARVANYGVLAVEVGVTLRVGPESEVARITIPAGSIMNVPQRVTFDAAGPVAIEAEITVSHEQNALSSDDRRYGSLQVLPGLQAVLVSDADRDDANGVVRPLHAALTAGGLSVRHSDRAGIANDGVNAAIIVTAGLTSGPNIEQRLLEHVTGGGTWVQVVTSDADAALTMPPQEPPIQLGNRVDISAQERGSITIGQARLDHALLAPFQGRESLLTTLAAYRYRLTPQPPAADAIALLAYADGTVAMAERPVGRGRWVILNCAPSAVDSTLGRGEVLPLLLAQMPAALLPASSDQITREAGKMINVDGTWEDPNGQALAVVDGRVRLAVPGIYRRAGGELMASAIPGVESDLKQVDPAVMGLRQQTADAALTATATTPLWPWALVLMALALGLESLVAGGLRRGAQSP
jgi:Aerotolerance regulator N-terminal